MLAAGTHLGPQLRLEAAVFLDLFCFLEPLLLCARSNRAAYTVLLTRSGLSKQFGDGARCERIRDECADGRVRLDRGGRGHLRSPWLLQRHEGSTESTNRKSGRPDAPAGRGGFVVRVSRESLAVWQCNGSGSMAWDDAPALQRCTSIFGGSGPTVLLVP